MRERVFRIHRFFPDCCCLAALAFLLACLAGCATGPSPAPGADEAWTALEAIESEGEHNQVSTDIPPEISPNMVRDIPMDAPHDWPAPSSEQAFRNIQFSKDETDELVISLFNDSDVQWRRAPTGPGRMHFVFPGHSVPPSLAKVYQLHQFSHPVKNALLRNTAEGAELIVNATGPVRVQPQLHDGRLELAFEYDASVVPAVVGDAHQVIPRGPGVRTGVPVQLASLLDDGAPDRHISQTVFPGMRQDYTGDPISIDLQNIEVEHVLRLISEIAGYNLILDPEVSGRISMKLDNVPWDQVLDLVLIQKGLGKVQVGNILRISTIERLGTESRMISDARAEAARARIVEQELEPVQTAFIQINYATATELDNRLKPFLTRDRGTMSHDPRTNTLIVTDIPSNIQKIRGVVERLDRPERQVLIEARVVYATENFQRGIGIRWGGGIEGVTTEYYRGVYGASGSDAPINMGGVGTTGYLVNTPYPGPGDESIFGIGGFISKLVGPDMFTLDAQLQLGELKGESRTVSSPRIVTLNNNSAEIEQGISIATQVPDERGTRTEYVDAVLKLTVQPQITPDNTLILDLYVSDDDAPVQGGNIQIKRAQTKLLIENGQIIVLGGVLKTIERLDERRVPGVGDVPVLGWLFKNQLTQRQNQELLIFIRPTIL